MILCFDIGGTTIKVAEAFAVDRVTAGQRIPTPTQDYAAFTAVLKHAVQAATRPPEGLAFSIAGVSDPVTGALKIANIPCLNGRNLKADLVQELGLPVVVANDADCFTLAEATLGAGRGHEVVFGLILGTGVGGGVVVRGRLINGSGGYAGEIGHGPIAAGRVFAETGAVLPDIACGCGQSGCLDALCSARGIERLHRYLHGGPDGNLHGNLHPNSSVQGSSGQSLTGTTGADSREIIAARDAGGEQASRTVRLWLEILSGPLAVMQNMLGAGVVAVGGGLSNSHSLVAALDQAVRQRCLQTFNRPLVVPAQCRVEPGLIGAAILGSGPLRSD